MSPLFRARCGIGPHRMVLPVTGREPPSVTPSSRRAWRSGGGPAIPAALPGDLGRLYVHLAARSSVDRLHGRGDARRVLSLVLTVAFWRSLPRRPGRPGAAPSAGLRALLLWVLDLLAAQAEDLGLWVQPRVERRVGPRGGAVPTAADVARLDVAVDAALRRAGRPDLVRTPEPVPPGSSAAKRIALQTGAEPPELAGPGRRDLVLGAKCYCAVMAKGARCLHCRRAAGGGA